MTYLTFKEYAEHKNVSPPAITYAVQSGRLKECVVENDNGMRFIDPEIADQEWEQNTDKSKLAGGLALKEKYKELTIKKKDTNSEGFDYQYEKARLEKFKADKAELEVDRETRKLLLKDEVEDIWTDFILNSRSILLALPTRMAAQMPSEVQNEVECIAKDCVYEALSELTNYEYVEKKEQDDE